MWKKKRQIFFKNTLNYKKSVILRLNKLPHRYSTTSFFSQSLILMKNFITISSAILLFFFAISCKNGDTTATTTAVAMAIPLPNTPEDVIRAWQAQTDQNQFAEAKRLSIGAALNTVVSMDSSEQIEHVKPIFSKILSINCQTVGDKSECKCRLEDAVGELDCTYYLERQKGQWYLNDAGCAPGETPTPTKSTTNKKPERPVNTVK